MKRCTNPDCRELFDRDDVVLCLKCGWVCIKEEAVKKNKDKVKEV
jgi:hypothetical protein